MGTALGAYRRGERVVIKFLFLFLVLISSHLLADGDYTKHEASLQQLQGKIFAAEKDIKVKLKEKNETKDPATTHLLAEEIQKLLAERKDTIQKFNKEYHHIRYEHPEKTGAFEKKYRRYDEKSIKEFEDEINKLLSDVYQNVKKKYNE